MNAYKGVVPVLLVVIALGGAYFFTYPQWTELGVNRAALAEVKKANDELKKSEADLQNFVRQYKAMEAERAQASKILPLKRDQMYDVLTNLDKFATTSGVNLSSLGVNEAADKGVENSITRIELTIEATGSYPSIKAFIMQLDSSLRLMDVDSILVQAQESTTLKVQLNLRTYYQK